MPDTMRTPTTRAATTLALHCSQNELDGCHWSQLNFQATTSTQIRFDWAEDVELAGCVEVHPLLADLAAMTVGALCRIRVDSATRFECTCAMRVQSSVRSAAPTGISPKPRINLGCIPVADYALACCVVCSVNQSNYGAVPNCCVKGSILTQFCSHVQFATLFCAIWQH